MINIWPALHLTRCLGLLYLCNENTGNDKFDFNVENNSRIKAEQGRPTDPVGPAGNYFSLTGPAGTYSDFKNRFDIFYRHGASVLETPQFFDANHFSKFSTTELRSCESVFCAPNCRSEAEIVDFRQQIGRDVVSRDSVQLLIATGSSNPNTTKGRESLRNFLIQRIHRNAAEVASYIASTDGDNSVYREVLSQTNAYDADLALANDYLGSNEISMYNTILNSVPAKYQLSSDALSAFNAYRAITDMMALHYTNGGNKYSLGSLQVNWLKDKADNSPYIRSRGMARRILRLYGYYYPVDMDGQVDGRTMTQETLQETVALFSVYPNPANQQILVHIETRTTESTGVRIRLIHSNGTLLAEKQMSIVATGDVPFAVQHIPAGIYLVQVLLESGEMETKRIMVVH